MSTHFLRQKNNEWIRQPLAPGAIKNENHAAWNDMAADQIDSIESRATENIIHIYPDDVLEAPTKNTTYWAKAVGAYANLKKADGSAAQTITVTPEQFSGNYQILIEYRALADSHTVSLKSLPKGDTGDKPAHEWDGTILKVQNPDGSMDAGVDLAIPSTSVVASGQTYNWTLTEGRSRNGIMVSGSGNVTVNGKTFALDSATTNNIFALVYVGGKYVILTKDANYTKKNDGTTDIAPDAANVTPPAPTAGVVDDTANTFAFTLATGYALADHEITTDAGATWGAASNPIVVGDVNKAINTVGVRVKAATGRNASSILYNQTEFTASTPTAMPSADRLASYRKTGVVPDVAVPTRAKRWNEAGGQTAKDFLHPFSVSEGNGVIINADGSLGFDGVARSLSIDPSGLAINYPFTIYALIKKKGDGGLLSPIEAGTYGLYMGGANTYVKTNSSYQSSSGVIANMAEFKVVCWKQQASNMPAKVFVDGVSIGTFNSTDLGSGAFDLYGLSSGGAGNYANLDIKGLDIYTVAHSDTDIATFSSVAKTEMA